MSLFLSGRSIVYTNQLVLETDILRTNIYKMVGDSKLAQTILASGLSNPILVSGTPCVPITPPGLAVTVGVGTIYAFFPMDETAYAVIPADTNPNHELFKQGVNFDPIDLVTPAPTVPGNSVIHLVQAIYKEEDKNLVSTPYFNPASTPTNPLPPIYENTFDTRASLMDITLKAGVEGISPSPPSPDAGWTGLYYVTVTFGQTFIISGDITEVPGAPFIKEGLTQKISKAAADTYYRPLKSLCGKVCYQPNTIQNVSALGNNKSVYDKVIYDDQNWWDPVNYWFLPNRSGKYRLTVYGQLFNLLGTPVLKAYCFFAHSTLSNGVISDVFFTAPAPQQEFATISGNTIFEFNGTTDHVSFDYGISGVGGYTYDAGAYIPGDGEKNNYFTIEYMGS